MELAQVTCTGPKFVNVVTCTGQTVQAATCTTCLYKLQLIQNLNLYITYIYIVRDTNKFKKQSTFLMVYMCTSQLQVT